MSPPLVSVLLPAFNAEATAAAAIESITAQTHDRWELLVADDASTDGTAEVLLEAAARDPRIQAFVFSQRSHQSVRLNQLIDRATGSLIARMDADDISHPRRLEKQVAFLQHHASVDVVGSMMLVIDDRNKVLGKRIGPTSHAAICRYPGVGFRLFGPTWLGRAEWFRRYRYRAEARVGEDQELLLRAYRDSTFANLAEPLFAYREAHIKVGPSLRGRANHVRLSLPILGSREKGAAAYGLAWHAARAAVDAAAVVPAVERRLQALRIKPLAATDAELWQLNADRVLRTPPQ